MSAHPSGGRPNSFGGRQLWAVQHLFSGQQSPPFMIEAGSPGGSVCDEAVAAGVLGSSCRCCCSVNVSCTRTTCFIPSPVTADGFCFAL
jgi:hypothetical protein